MPVNVTNPAEPSSDYKAMSGYWQKVDAILGGLEALRAGGRTFLPQFPEETDARYEHRRKTSKFTNVFYDVLDNLAKRPFAKEVQVGEGVPEQLAEFTDDVNGRGESLHTFAGEVFFNGLARALDWILIDYTKGVPAGATRAQELELGARPHWCRYSASQVVAAYSTVIAGREEFVHVRLLEDAVDRAGFGEETKERVRVLNREPLEVGKWGPPTWEVWEKSKTPAAGSPTWVKVDEGVLSISRIPLVPFLAGRRKGTSWQLLPPLRDAADLQIEMYEQESALKHVRSLTAFPMLAGNGISPPIGDNGEPKPVPVGPHAVLYAPPAGDGNAGSWTFIEPAGQSLTFLSGEVDKTEKQIRELGRQPLTAQSGNLTVVSSAVAAQKGTAAIQAWALNLRHSLEEALRYTAEWMGMDPETTDVGVLVDKDFDLGVGDDDTFEHVLKLRAAKEISRNATIDEAKRRGIMGPDYDADEDAEELLDDLEEAKEELEQAAQPPAPGAPNPANPGPAKPARTPAAPAA